jgi:plastocyanin
MRSITRGIAAFAVSLLLAACSGSGGGGSTQPAATSGGGGAAPCADSTGTTTVETTVADFKWAPVTAKVGDVITWTNSDSAPHQVGLDDNSCAMSKSIAGGGGKASLVFSKAGTFPFHCTIHSSMKGTITITQ